MEPRNLSEIWTQFQEENSARNTRALSELAAAHEDIRTLLQGVGSAFRAKTPDPRIAAVLGAVHSLYGDQAQELLHAPVVALERKRPLQRALSALQSLDAGLEDLLRRIPNEAGLTGIERVELAGPDAGPAWRRWQLGLTKSPHSVAIRELVRQWMWAFAARRSRAEGRFLIAVQKAALHLTVAWQIWRRHRLCAIAASPGDRAFESESAWWTQKAEMLGAEAASSLGNLKPLFMPQGLGSALLLNPGRVSERRREQRQEALAHWARLQRTVLSQIALETSAARMEETITRHTAVSIDSIVVEHDELLSELNTVLEELQRSASDPESCSFPAPKASMISAGERTREWERNVTGEAKRLPESVETIASLEPLPGFRTKWRAIEPAPAFQTALEGVGHPSMKAAFTEVEAAHQAIVREIERAREVVAFGIETAAEEGSEGAQIARESVANAIALLEFQKQNTTEVRPQAERSSVAAQARMLLEFQGALDRGRLGVLTHVARQRGLRLVGELGRSFQGALRRGVRSTGEAAVGLWEAALTRIGLLTPPRAVRPAVEQTARLSQILALTLGERDFPAIYRRLFRLAPLEDARFLVGREREMAGLADALAQWESGSHVAVMVIGARGSGKTSLLNCAASRVFAELAIVRGAFCERISTPDELHRFLRELFRFEPDADLRIELSRSRKVVILEEFERIFLRRLNGFDALKDFIDLIDATSQGILWIVITNENTFKYLQAIQRIDHTFTHRIHAMSVSPEAIRTAILQRHNLSGLRLEFAPPAAGDPRVSKVRKFLGIVRDPQELFFDSLYRQSEGVFRSAYELWQDSIHRTEAGVVYMQQPLDPAYKGLRAELVLDDCFALQALQQHGSLTTQELAEVLRWTDLYAARRMKHLLDLEIIEQEPVCPGLRVKPQAGRFVREILHGRNL
jgi:hypothetical protein